MSNSASPSPAREGLHVEFKTARDSLPGNLFDTVCAFLNTDGGTIYLGIEDDGTPNGVAEQAVTRFRREIADCSNNPQKLDPPYLLFPRAETRDGKTIITLQVPPQLPNPPAQGRNLPPQRGRRLSRQRHPPARRPPQSQTRHLPRTNPAARLLLGRPASRAL